MKNLTVFAAALAAGLMTFAAYAQEEGAMPASATAAKPTINASDRTKDDLAIAPSASQPKRALTTEESFHAAKAAAPAIKEQRQKDDAVQVAVKAAPVLKEARQKDDAVQAAAKAAAPVLKEARQKDDAVQVAAKAAAPVVEEAKQKDDAVQVAAKPEDRYGPIIERYASENDVPVDLAHAVITVESNYRPYSLGRAGEVGLMQIKPATAKMMGYSGSKTGLFDPETNIKYGMKYLGKARKLGDGTTCSTILKYNAGHAAKRMNPTSRAYCKKVKTHLATVKATLVGF